MAVIVIRELDYSAIQSLTQRTPAQPYTFKRGTTPQIGVQFADESGNPVVLDTYASGVRTFNALPAANALENIAGTDYTWRAALTGAADEILIGANVAAAIANLVGAVNASAIGGQAAGTTYGVGTAQNLFAGATASGNAVIITSLLTGVVGNTYVTTTTDPNGAWAAATLAGGYTARIILGAKPANPSNTVSPGTPAYDGAYAINGTVNGPPDENGIYWVNMSFSNDDLNALLGYNPPTINDDVSSVNLFAAVKTVVGAAIEESAQFTITVWHDINQGVEPALTETGVVFRGTLALDNGVNAGQVTGLAMPGAPNQVFASVSKNSGDLNLRAYPKRPYTADGFYFDLDGITDEADYEVDYLVLI